MPGVSLCTLPLQLEFPCVLFLHKYDDWCCISGLIKARSPSSRSSSYLRLSFLLTTIILVNSVVFGLFVFARFGFNEEFVPAAEGSFSATSKHCRENWYAQYSEENPLRLAFFLGSGSLLPGRIFGIHRWMSDAHMDGYPWVKTEVHVTLTESQREIAKVLDEYPKIVKVLLNDSSHFHHRRMVDELFFAYDKFQNASRPKPHWIIMGDDDTMFFLPNFVSMLSRLYMCDPLLTPMTLGGTSEREIAIGHSPEYNGGASISVSWAGARKYYEFWEGNSDRVMNHHVVRNSRASDIRLARALMLAGVPLDVNDQNLHQTDTDSFFSLGNHFDVRFSRDPVATLHHVPDFEPLFPDSPSKNTTEELDRLFLGYEAADPAVFLAHLHGGFSYRTFGYSLDVIVGYRVRLITREKTANEIDVHRHPQVCDGYFVGKDLAHSTDGGRSCWIYSTNISYVSSDNDSLSSRNFCPGGNLSSIRVCTSFFGPFRHGRWVAENYEKVMAGHDPSLQITIPQIELERAVRPEIIRNHYVAMTILFDRNHSDAFIERTMLSLGSQLRYAQCMFGTLFIAVIPSDGTISDVARSERLSKIIRSRAGPARVISVPAKATLDEITKAVLSKMVRNLFIIFHIPQNDSELITTGVLDKIGQLLPWEFPAWKGPYQQAIFAEESRGQTVAIPTLVRRTLGKRRSSLSRRSS